MPTKKSQVGRRAFLATAAATGAATAIPFRSITHAAEGDAPSNDFKVSKGRIKQSVMAWCFNPMPMETLVPACAKMGLVAMEGIDTKYYSLMKQNGLAVSIAGSHGFAQGPVNPEYTEMCHQKIRDGIDTAVRWNCKTVITFTGMRVKGMSVEQGTKNCVDFWKSVIGYAEEKGVNLALEHLNSRDDTHPMKGHPGYFGDDVDHCVDMIRQVDSPNMKLLFDIYHVQVMNGDIIRRFRQFKDVIGHVHTAGNPGRAEIDETQEINYPAVMKAILDTGYDGYVAQEFIPTWKDKIAALRHAVQLCDI